MATLRLSLRAQLVLLVVATTVPLILWVGFNAYRQADAGLDRARTNLKFASSLGAMHVAQVVESSRQVLVTISSTLRVQLGTAEACSSFFRSVGPSLSGYSNVGVINPDGYVRCSKMDQGEQRTFLADRAYFQETLQTGRFTVSAFVRGRITGKNAVVFAQPIISHEDGRITGVVFGALDLQYLKNAVDKLNLPAITRFRVMDRDGTVMAASDEYLGTVGSQVGVPVLQRAVKAAVAGIEMGDDGAGRQRIFAFAPVGSGTGMFVSVSLDRDAAIAIAVNQVAVELLGLIVLILLACYGAWRAGGRVIVGPTRQILDATAQLKGGHAGTRIESLPDLTANELRQISEGFNLMAESLQQRERQHEDDEARIQRAHHLLDQVINSMQEAVVAVDPTGCMTLRNQAALALFELKQPGGPPPEQWPAHFGLYHAGTDRMLSPQDLPTYRGLQGETGRDFDIDGHHLLVPGIRTLRCSFRPMRSGSEIVGAVVVITDITDLRALQAGQARNQADQRELQRKLVEAQQIGHIGNWELDLATQRLWWSDETYALFGIAQGAFDGTLATVLQVMHPDDREHFMKRREESVAAGQAFETEYRIVWPDGQLRWIHQIGRVYGDESGKVVRRAGIVQDITARKQSEQALAASEHRYAVLFRQCPLPLWVYDPDTLQFLAVNDATAQLYGYSQEEFTRLRMSDIRSASGLHPQGLKTGQSLQAEENRRIHLRRDGSEFPVQIVSRRIPYQGRSAMFVVALDISARVAAEAEVQDYVFTLQRAADAAQAITQHASLQGTLQEVVEQARGVVGAHMAAITIHQREHLAQALSAISLSEKYAQWRDKDMPLPSSGGIFALVCETNRTVRLTQAELGAHPLWRGFGSRAAEHPPMRGWLAVPLVGAKGENMGVLQLSDKYEGEFSERDGYVVNEMAHLAAAAIEKARLIAEISSLNTDLEVRIVRRTAELVRQEALFRALAEQAPQVVWTIDARGVATYFNRHWYELVGGTPADWLGFGWLRLLHPDDQADVRSNWEQARTQLSTFVGVRRVCARDGSYHTMSYRAAPVRGAQGEVSFWVGIDSDITELKAVEAALVQSNRELEAFSYSVSHDLRSPLNTIDGFSRLLERQVDAATHPKAMHYLARIQAGAAQMGQLIEGLLSLAQISRTSLRHEPVDLSRIAREVLERLQENSPQRQVTVVVEEGLSFGGDSRLMRVVMENLLGNAWKFTSNRERAEITVGQLPGQRVFFVRDSGAGFDMAYKDKLFGVFQRLHSASEFPGTGIGLATVQRVIERHGGKIWAQSEPGKGATFFFTVAE